MLTINEVAKEVGIASRTGVYRVMAMDPSFPRAAKIPGLKGKRWALGDVLAWKDHKLEQARAENAARLANAKKGARK